MNAKTYNWETSFDTANSIMQHTFAGGVKLTTNRLTGKSVLHRDAERIAEYQNVDIGKYEDRLVEIAEQAEKLRSFEP